MSAEQGARVTAYVLDASGVQRVPFEFDCGHWWNVGPLRTREGAVVVFPHGTMSVVLADDGIVSLRLLETEEGR